MRANLHMHSTASDGVFSPRALMDRFADAGFDLVALTDHDSVAGVEEARDEATARGMRLIPGAEFSCGAGREIHVLGLGLDIRNEELLAFFDERERQREERGEKMVQRLAENGAAISLTRVRELAHGVIGRPHVAQALMEAGYVKSTDEAFERYLKQGRCAYVPKPEVRVCDVIARIHRAGGVAVIAHPMEMQFGDLALESILREWAAQGLDGIEAYHPSAQNHQAAWLDRLARAMGLLVTGGSDFHGEHLFPDIAIDEGLERWTTVERDVQALLSRIDRD